MRNENEQETETPRYSREKYNNAKYGEPIGATRFIETPETDENGWVVGFLVTTTSRGWSVGTTSFNPEILEQFDRDWEGHYFVDYELIQERENGTSQENVDYTVYELLEKYYTEVGEVIERKVKRNITAHDMYDYSKGL